MRQIGRLLSTSAWRVTKRSDDVVGAFSERSQSHKIGGDQRDQLDHLTEAMAHLSYPLQALVYLFHLADALRYTGD